MAFRVLFVLCLLTSWQQTGLCYSRILDYYLKLYQDSQPANSLAAVRNIDLSETLVHKCCGLTQYYDASTASCNDLDLQEEFLQAVLDLTTSHTEVKLFSSQIFCHGTLSPPKITMYPSRLTHLILPRGLLQERNSKEVFQHDQYCLELLGHNETDVSLVVASCPVEIEGPYKTGVRKCCRLKDYLDRDTKECLPRPTRMRNYSLLVDHFLEGSNENGHANVYMGEKFCTYAPPELLTNEQAELDEAGNLCVENSKEGARHCFSQHFYCIDHLWKPGDLQETAVAFLCPLDEYYMEIANSLSHNVLARKKQKP